MSALIHVFPGADRIPNVSMLYLLVVTATALRFGGGPAILASVLSFLAFDWFFVEPRQTFTVRDPAEWLALLMFLVTAATMGHLTASARRQTIEAKQRAREIAALSEASWAIASQVDRDRALAEVLRRLSDVLPVTRSAIVVPAESPTLEVVARWPESASAAAVQAGALRIARFVLERGSPVGWGDDRAQWDKALEPDEQRSVAYLPLSVEHRTLGVLCLQLPPDHSVSAAERRVAESLANHAAVALERDRLARAESRANALVEADRLKTALLSMVSHDFRSPLASIKASATACIQGEARPDATTQRELHQGIIQEADRLNGMVGNILALSRLEADAWRPQAEEAALEEVIEAARSGLSRERNRRIQVELTVEMDEAWLDPVQIAQVLHNLLDNGLKYSPPDTRVELRVLRNGDWLQFEVGDRGAGLPSGEEGRVFERFYRAPALRDSAVPGMGIGLSVCRGLVEAHGGTLTAANREGGGAMFRMSLPVRGAV